MRLSQVHSLAASDPPAMPLAIAPGTHRRRVQITAVIEETRNMAPTVPVSRATRGNPDGNPIGERPMAEDISCDRRRFLGTAAMTMAAAQFGMIGAATAQSSTTTPAELPTMKPGAHTSFGALQQIDAGVLHVGYAEAGPADGPAVIP